MRDRFTVFVYFQNCVISNLCSYDLDLLKPLSELCFRQNLSVDVDVKAIFSLQVLITVVIS